MTNSALAEHPFGTVITEETLKQTFAPLLQWEDKYRQLILLGKQLPALSDERKAQAKEISGCENRVWLGCTVSGEKLPFLWRQRRAYRSRAAGGTVNRRGREKRGGAADALAAGIVR